MSSYSAPRQAAFKTTDADAHANLFVKFGSADDKVDVAGAGEKTCGVGMNSPTAAGDQIEVALPGGGAKLTLGGTVTRGKFLKSDSAGKGVQVTAEGDLYGAMAMASGVSGDVIPVEVMNGTAHASAD